ncbi:hypothetical protein KBY78_06095, partial [Synechococcus sp. EJ6-Ellesmere]|nr:hypothetical protein [Synechococcus sp. EJ6-Ellesmere]
MTPFTGQAASVALGLTALLAGASVTAGEVTATGGALGLGTAVNGLAGGSCAAGLCQVGGGTRADRNLFHRFSAFDTRGGITGVNFATGGSQNVFVGVTNPLGSFIDKLISLSSPGNLYWLSPGGIAISGAGGFANIQQLNLSTATSWRLGNGVFDAAGTTAGQAALLSGTPLQGAAGPLTDPASLAAIGLQTNGDLSLSGGLLTVDQSLLLDAQGGNVLLQAAGIQAPSLSINGHSLLQNTALTASGSSGGSVRINATGSVVSGAPIEAKGRAGAGGSIAISAGQAVVQSAGALLDASGSSAGGSISIQAGKSLFTSATATALGTGAGAKGGTIELTAPTVNLAAARIDASGSGGGGAVRVGGGYQGQPLSLGGANASSTTVNAASTLEADA